MTSRENTSRRRDIPAQSAPLSTNDRTSDRSQNRGRRQAPTTSSTSAQPIYSSFTSREEFEIPQNRRSGKVKWYNVVNGFGFITPDDGSQDVFIHQTSIYMEGFRSLDDDERVEFTCRKTEKGMEASFVCGPGGAPCRGSHRKPVGSRRNKRCFNCGSFGHFANQCPSGPLPKCCYICHSTHHLQEECPERRRSSGERSSRDVQ